MVSEELLSELREEIAKLFPHGVTAACLYGSHAAGYARKDSDFDLIVVLERLREGVRYRYARKPPSISLLLVDKESLLKDAKRGFLGEFVIGRLLNRYIPVVGEEFLREVETIYKERVIREELDELLAEHGEFVDFLKIPLEYFLFSKLKKRAEAYPIVRYSYGMTYSGSLKQENLKFTLEGFRRAAHRLAERRLVGFDREHVKVLRAKKVLLFPLLLRRMTTVTLQYLVHMYSGRVGADVVLREIVSKARRAGKTVKVEELTHPKRLLRSDEFVLIADVKDWVSYLCRSLGFEAQEYRSKSITTGLRRLFTTVKLLTVKGPGFEKKFVVKRFRDVRNVKWVFLTITRPIRGFSLSPVRRMANEVMYNLRLRNLGFSVPRLMAVDINRLQLVSEYIEGDRLDKLIREKSPMALPTLEAFGRELGKIHSLGISIGDTKPENLLVSRGVIYITDLEQASEEDLVWDVAEFVYFSSSFSIDRKWLSAAMAEFARGYLKTGRKEHLERALSEKYALPFRILSSPLVLREVSKSLRRVISSAP